MKRSTAEIFTDVTRLLCENNTEEMFATAWIGILDTETHLITYTNAGHNSPCFAKSGGAFEFLKKRHGLMLAGMEDTVYKESTLELQSGDTIFQIRDRWHTQYVAKECTDTFYKAKVDSVPVPFPVIKKVPAELTWWQQCRIHLANIVLWVILIIALWWALRQCRKLKIEP